MAPDYSVELWISHAGVKDNEKADKLASTASSQGTLRMDKEIARATLGRLHMEEDTRSGDTHQEDGWVGRGEGKWISSQTEWYSVHLHTTSVGLVPSAGVCFSGCWNRMRRT